MAQPHPRPADRPDAITKQILGSEDIKRSLSRIAYQIVEHNHGAQGLVLAGIPTRGATLARRLVARVGEIAEARPDLGIVDATMYRDDLADQPMRTPHVTLAPAGGVDGRPVVLVDDVLYTGRTVKAALDALLDLGRPASVQLAVLVDRGHRELPIRADYVGRNIPTSREESVEILLRENDGRDAVVLTRGRAA